MRSKRLMAAMMLAVWVLLEPAAGFGTSSLCQWMVVGSERAFSATIRTRSPIAFNGCDGMGGICQVLCNLPCYGESALISVAALRHFAYLSVRPSEHPPTLIWRDLAFPP